MRTAFDRLNDACNAVGTAWILLLMVLINGDILGRALFSAPIAGVPEIVEASILGIVYLQLGHSLRSGRMTRSELLLDNAKRSRPRLGHGADAAMCVLGAAFMALIAAYAVPEVQKSLARGSFHGTRGVFTIPQWPLDALIVLGGTITAVQFALLAADHARAARR